MEKSNRIFVIFLAFATACILSACITLVAGMLSKVRKAKASENHPAQSNDPSNPANAGNITPIPSITNVNPAGIVNYGARVYYFPLTGAKFASTLADFLLSETNLEVTAIAPNIIPMDGRSPASPDDHSYGLWGGTAGYFVTFKEKKSD